MPRRSSGFRSSKPSGFGFKSSKASHPSPRAPTQKMPTKTTPTPPATTTPSGGMFGGMGSAIAQGVGFGAGSQIGHEAIRAFTGSNNKMEATQDGSMATQGSQEHQSAYPCTSYMNDFFSCLKSNANSITSCQNFWNELNSCESNLKGKQM